MTCSGFRRPREQQKPHVEKGRSVGWQFSGMVRYIHDCGKIRVHFRKLQEL